MPSATTRAARRSCWSASSTPSSDRACPALSTPAATRRCTAGESLSSRMVLEICGPGPADPLGQLVVGAAEVLEQLLVGGRLLERVELGAVQVLQQRVAEHVGVVGGPDDRGDPLEPGLLGGPPPALAHDQLVARRTPPPGPAGPRSAGAGPPRGSSGRARPSRPRRRPGAAARGSARSGRPAPRRTSCPRARPGRARTRPRRARRRVSGGASSAGAVGISEPRPRPRPRRTVGRARGSSLALPSGHCWVTAGSPAGPPRGRPRGRTALPGDAGS